MTDLQIRVIDRLDTATFEELVECVQQSVLTAEGHARRAIEALIEAGGALCAMRDRMPGEYQAWLKQSGVNVGWTARCQRIYTYRDCLPLSVFETYTSPEGRTFKPNLSRAIESISTLPRLTWMGHKQELPVPVVETIRRMKADGHSIHAITTATGIYRRLVQDVVDPSKAKRERVVRATIQRNDALMRAAAKRQLDREERDRLAKSSGKELSIAYAAVRQALAALDRMDAPLDQERASRASAYLTSAESCIVAVMKMERTR